ncbi:NAD(P)-binding Rossmann-fold superfamily protein [Striga asiatica]|uniref:NAD(P)-binding Rossmann-fold superfamily protein n=1 Tax=Striga asiatica TaxID=4170 RepID=A0A5A7R1H4_STRAF|nr:NAD(P)-binding Rossmann-fold superfamily protein [Striga asiatica]
MPRLSVLVTQEECLYDDRWTKEADNLFIDLLMEENAVGEWKYGRPVSSVFDSCRLEIKEELNINFTLGEVEMRLDFLQKHYSVFSWMLRKHGLRHCVQSNVLTAPVAVWDDIFESNSLSVAYQHCGDPRWNELKFLFTSVYGASPETDVVQDVHSTNEYVVGAQIESSDLVSEPSNNNVMGNCPVGDNFYPHMRPRERDMPSECSVNTQPHVFNPRRGSQTPRRIPRPPHNSSPSSCKGSSNDPLI